MSNGTSTTTSRPETTRTFRLFQQEVAWCRGSDDINEQDIQRAFLLWSFVHGLSFLRIDGEFSKVDFTFDAECALIEVANRVLSDDVPAA